MFTGYLKWFYVMNTLQNTNYFNNYISGKAYFNPLNMY